MWAKVAHLRCRRAEAAKHLILIPLAGQREAAATACCMQLCTQFLGCWFGWPQGPRNGYKQDEGGRDASAVVVLPDVSYGSEDQQVARPIGSSTALNAAWERGCLGSAAVTRATAFALRLIFWPAGLWNAVPSVRGCGWPESDPKPVEGGAKHMLTGLKNPV